MNREKDEKRKAASVHRGCDCVLALSIRQLTGGGWPPTRGEWVEGIWLGLVYNDRDSLLVTGTMKRAPNFQITKGKNYTAQAFHKPNPGPCYLSASKASKDSWAMVPSVRRVCDSKKHNKKNSHSLCTCVPEMKEKF